jgi:hypothetical protein
MLFRRLYFELEWASQNVYDILKPEWKYDVYIDTAGDKAEETAISTNDREEYSEDEEIKRRKITPKGSKHIITHNFTI